MIGYQVQKPYSTRIQQRHRPRTAATVSHRSLTCSNDHQRPRRQEFASRGSGVQSPQTDLLGHLAQRVTATSDGSDGCVSQGRCQLVAPESSHGDDGTLLQARPIASGSSWGRGPLEPVPARHGHWLLTGEPRANVTVWPTHREYRSEGQARQHQ